MFSRISYGFPSFCHAFLAFPWLVPGFLRVSVLRPLGDVPPWGPTGRSLMVGTKHGLRHVAPSLSKEEGLLSKYRSGWKKKTVDFTTMGVGLLQIRRSQGYGSKSR